MKRALCLLAVLLLSGCADKMALAEAALKTPVGFWFGLWHGFILPWAWLISLFSDSTAIYAVYNNGGWYNFGFVIGIYVLGVTGEGLSRNR